MKAKLEQLYRCSSQHTMDISSRRLQIITFLRQARLRRSSIFTSSVNWEASCRAFNANLKLPEWSSVLTWLKLVLKMPMRRFPVWKLTWQKLVKKCLVLTRKNANLASWVSYAQKISKLFLISLIKRPATIGSHITNCKILAHRNVVTAETGSSAPCGHCTLCENFGRHRTSMVNYTEVLKTRSKTVVPKVGGTAPLEAMRKSRGGGEAEMGGKGR